MGSKPNQNLFLNMSVINNPHRVCVLCLVIFLITILSSLPKNPTAM